MLIHLYRASTTTPQQLPAQPFPPPPPNLSVLRLQSQNSRRRYQHDDKDEFSRTQSTRQLFSGTTLPGLSLGNRTQGRDSPLSVCGGRGGGHSHSRHATTGDLVGRLIHMWGEGGREVTPTPATQPRATSLGDSFTRGGRVGGWVTPANHGRTPSPTTYRCHGRPRSPVGAGGGSHSRQPTDDLVPPANPSLPPALSETASLRLHSHHTASLRPPSHHTHVNDTQPRYINPKTEGPGAGAYNTRTTMNRSEVPNVGGRGPAASIHSTEARGLADNAKRYYGGGVHAPPANSVGFLPPDRSARLDGPTAQPSPFTAVPQVCRSGLDDTYSGL